jgi:[acyl-carrier-protein] S-malonyltransferase
MKVDHKHLLTTSQRDNQNHMNNNNNIVVCPGQGSQEIGMGLELAKAFPPAREVFAEVDDAISFPLFKLMTTGDIDELTKTENAQPAIMACSVAIWRIIAHSATDQVKIADFAKLIAGHSLGEYSAYCIANSLSLADTARLLRTRGQAMQGAAPLGTGAMAAIIGLEYATINEVLSAITTADNIVVIANDNSDGQVVISGHKTAVEQAISQLQQAGAKRAVLLNVSAPFHSPLMQPAQEVMAEALQDVEFNDPDIPIIANVSAEVVDNAQQAKQLLTDQVTGQVRWRPSMLKASALGVETLYELGHGKVLSGLQRRIDRSIKTLTFDDLAASL